MESPEGFTVRPTSVADYERLLDRLGESNRLPDSVVHLLWAARPGDGAPPDLMTEVRGLAAFLSLLALGQALPWHLADDARLLVVTAGGCATRPGEPVRLGRGTIAGLALTIPQEHLGIVVRTLNLPAEDQAEPSRQTDPSRQIDLAKHIATELSWPGPEPVVAIRGDVRLVRRYRPVDTVPTTDAVRLRERGVYLITGGLGRIGLLTAAHFARRAKVRLVLTSRQGLPAPDRWADLLAGRADGDGQDPTAHRIRAVQEIEALGAEVMVAALDLGDGEAIRGLLRQLDARFGELNGVIHAAGTTERSSFAPIATLDPQSLSAHMVPKVYGTLALDAALAGRPLDFCLAMSSMSTLLGGVAFSGYASANSFLDLLAESAAGRQRWTAIDWDTWKSTIDRHVLGDLGRTLDQYSIAPAAGVELLEALLGGERPRMIVAAGDLEQRLRVWVTDVAALSAAKDGRRRNPVPTTATQHAVRAGTGGPGRGHRRSVGGGAGTGAGRRA